MYYVVSFDGCGLDSPLKSRSAIAALALAEEAERNGCANVVIAGPDGAVMALSSFAARHGQAGGGQPS